jgi:excisionase family DNA binding protein
MEDLEMVTAMAEKLLTVGEAAEYLSVSPSSLRRWTDAGQLRAMRLPGGARRYEVVELDRWRQEHYIDDMANRPGGEA